jgi:hypothetical protein
MEGLVRHGDNKRRCRGLLSGYLDNPATDRATDRSDELMETVVYNGGEVKALGDGKVGGYLVTFGDSKHTDLEGDYFTPSTDFDLERSTKATVLYNHGLDKTLKGKKLGVGEMKVDDAGVWIEAQLELRDDYERAIYDMAQKGKLGWSSGTAAHLVERKKSGKSYEILSWALGLDASLTPTPAEPRCLAMSLKSWQSEMKLSDPLEHIDQRLTSAVLNRLIDALYSACWQVVESEDTSIEERMALWTDTCAGISEKGAGLLKDFLAQPESAQEEMKSYLKGRISEWFLPRYEILRSSCERQVSLRARR